MSMINMALNCLIFLLHIIVCVSTANGDAKCRDRCCFNFYEDANGKCVECPFGTFGVDCNVTCSHLYFGYLCKNKCDCPADQCDRKYGCKTNSKEKETQVFSSTSVESTDKWMKVAFALIGSVLTLGLIGLLIFLRSWFAKRGNPQRDINNHLRENLTNPDEDEHRYEENRSLPPSDGVEDGRSHLQADENNYTDLRFSCMYDNPLEGEGDPKIGTTLPNAAAILFGDNDLTSSDDSSDENDVIESYEHVIEREAYNVLSLRRPCTSNILTVGTVLDGGQGHAEGTHDGYQPVLFTGTKTCTDETERMKSMSMKSSCRQSLITETIQEYIEASNVTRKHSLSAHLNKQGEGNGAPSDGSSKMTRPYSVAKATWESDSKRIKNIPDNPHINALLNIKDLEESDKESIASKKSDEQAQCRHDPVDRRQDDEITQKSRDYEIIQKSKSEETTRKSQNGAMSSDLLTDSENCLDPPVYTQVKKKKEESELPCPNESETHASPSGGESVPESEKTISKTDIALGHNNCSDYETCSIIKTMEPDVSDITYCLLCFLLFFPSPDI
ncbi:uncharacterized protein LOC144626785 isoform X1 [Crassostrea virginica]